MGSNRLKLHNYINLVTFVEIEKEDSIIEYFSNALRTFLNMLEDWKEESSRLQKMDLNSDYIVYTNRKNKINQLVKELKECYSEICKVKHLIQCIAQENFQNKEDLKYIEGYYKESQVHGENVPDDKLRDEYNLHFCNKSSTPALTYEVFV